MNPLSPTVVHHADGSTGQIVASIYGVGPGQDVTGAWRVPVHWTAGARQGSSGFVRRTDLTFPGQDAQVPSP